MALFLAGNWVCLDSECVETVPSSWGGIYDLTFFDLLPQVRTPVDHDAFFTKTDSCSLYCPISRLWKPVFDLSVLVPPLVAGFLVQDTWSMRKNVNISMIMVIHYTNVLKCVFLLFHSSLDNDVYKNLEIISRLISSGALLETTLESVCSEKKCTRSMLPGLRSKCQLWRNP